MPVKFFGQFLLEKGIVTNELLLKAVDLQDATNLKFGEMAKAMGLISDADIARVHDAQRREDLLFGDMCVKLGIITMDRLKEVLAKQKSTHLYIGEALIKVGAIKADELKKHLDAFKTDQAPYAAEKVAIPAGVSDAAVWELSADLTFKMLSRVANLTFRQGRCSIVRKLETNDTMVSIGLSGSIRAQYIVSVSREVRNAMARAILNTADVGKEGEDMLLDTVMEFANIVCGNIAAKAAQTGIHIEIAPPQVLSGSNGVPVPDEATGLLFPVHVAEGRLEIGMFVWNK